MLRADFTMDETYYDKAGIVLHTPIAAFGGEKVEFFVVFVFVGFV